MSRPKKPGGTGDGLPMVAVRLEPEVLHWLKKHSKYLRVTVAEYIRSLILVRKQLFDRAFSEIESKIEVGPKPRLLGDALIDTYVEGVKGLENKEFLQEHCNNLTLNEAKGYLERYIGYYSSIVKQLGRDLKGYKNHLKNLKEELKIGGLKELNDEMEITGILKNPETQNYYLIEQIHYYNDIIDYTENILLNIKTCIDERERIILKMLAEKIDSVTTKKLDSNNN